MLGDESEKRVSFLDEEFSGRVCSWFLLYCPLCSLPCILTMPFGNSAFRPRTFSFAYLEDSGKSIYRHVFDIQEHGMMIGISRLLQACS